MRYERVDGDILADGILACDHVVRLSGRNPQTEAHRAQRIGIVEHSLWGSPGVSQSHTRQILLGRAVLVIVHLHHDLRAGLQEITRSRGRLGCHISGAPARHHVSLEAGPAETGITLTGFGLIPSRGDRTPLVDIDHDVVVHGAIARDYLDDVDPLVALELGVEHETPILIITFGRDLIGRVPG